MTGRRARHRDWPVLAVAAVLAAVAVALMVALWAGMGEMPVVCTPGLPVQDAGCR